MTSNVDKNSSEVLEVPNLPPITSQFILPPPRSDLLDRLQAFLPKIKSANELLESKIPVEGEEPEEEGVIVEIIDSSDEESDSSSEEEQEEEEEEEAEKEEVESSEGEEGRLKRLMEIGSGGIKSSKKASVGDSEPKKAVGIVEMDS